MANLEVSSIPSSLLISFFETAKSRLDESEIENSTSSTNIRRLLLGIQNTCLEKVVEEYNEQQQQQQQQLDSEKHISTDIVRQVLPQLKLNAETEESVKKALTEMNEAARLAFCRLILYSECLRKFAQHNNSNHNTDAPPLQTSGTFLRDDILEPWEEEEAAAAPPREMPESISCHGRSIQQVVIWWLTALSYCLFGGWMEELNALCFLTNLCVFSSFR